MITVLDLGNSFSGLGTGVGVIFSFLRSFPLVWTTGAGTGLGERGLGDFGRIGLVTLGVFTLLWLLLFSEGKLHWFFVLE